MQLGLCAFRHGMIKDAHNALHDVQSSGRAKELLAQVCNVYRKHPQISHTFFPKIVAQNRGCGLSSETFQKGAVHFSELTLL